LEVPDDSIDKSVSRLQSADVCAIFDFSGLKRDDTTGIPPPQPSLCRAHNLALQGTREHKLALGLQTNINNYMIPRKTYRSPTETDCYEYIPQFSYMLFGF